MTYATAAYARKLAMEGYSGTYIYEKLVDEGWLITREEAEQVLADCNRHRGLWESTWNK